jgi:hypothetical protein
VDRYPKRLFVESDSQLLVDPVSTANIVESSHLGYSQRSKSIKRQETNDLEVAGNSKSRAGTERFSDVSSFANPQNCNE